MFTKHHQTQWPCTSYHCVRSAFCHGHCVFISGNLVYIAPKKLDNTLDAILEGSMLPSNDAVMREHQESTDLASPGKTAAGQTNPARVEKVFLGT